MKTFVLAGPVPAETVSNRSAPQRTLNNPIGMQQNGWQPHGKLLASGMPFQREAALDNEARMADQLAA
ncbi:hypothetical protein ACQI5H_20635 [Mycobacterium heidelbergense]|uniref:hypothetical protein n=1 Tax=Mycobacterium heidelbergense TaxID=53376 RepID=UPI003CEBADFD